MVVMTATPGEWAFSTHALFFSLKPGYKNPVEDSEDLPST